MWALSFREYSVNSPDGKFGKTPGSAVQGSLVWERNASRPSGKCGGAGSTVPRTDGSAPRCRLGQAMPFVGTSEGLSAKSLVLLSFEFPKPTNVGTRPCPLRTVKPKRRLVGLELLNHASVRLHLLGNGALESRDPWSSGQIQVELLSLT